MGQNTFDKFLNDDVLPIPMHFCFSLMTRFSVHFGKVNCFSFCPFVLFNSGLLVYYEKISENENAYFDQNIMKLGYEYDKSAPQELSKEQSCNVNRF
jgi:hypothetical protein